jgi:hypothetical protein
LIIAAITGYIAKWIWDKRTGIIIGTIVFSHWILDLIVHRPDLPILPGNAGNLPLLGFALWNIPAASAMLELLLVIGGAYLYYKAARKAPKANKVKSGKPLRAILASGVTCITMVMLLISDVFTLSLGLSMLLILLLIFLCGWLDARLGWHMTTKKQN